MNKESKYGKLLYGVFNFLIFFALSAFLITCSTMLFVTVLSASLNITLTGDNLEAAAKLTFLNVIFLSLIFTVIDAIRRKFTVERPVNRITAAAEKIMQGDFNARVEPIGRFGADDKFNEIVDCFNDMAEELSGVETLRTDFIANVSHEMKTPLTVIQNYGKLLSAEELSSDKRKEYAESITTASKRLSDMMTNILKLNRLENQQIFPKTEEFDLGEQLCECLLQYENVWEKQNIEIETDIEENITVKADKELLSLVWNNLFSNAFKFTPEGGRVTVALKSTQNHARVTVTDTGCGMSPEIGSHIFEKFYQGDTSHSSQGNGLGLALVKRVVDIMRAEISVESAVNKGSAFTVTLRRH